MSDNPSHRLSAEDRRKLSGLGEIEKYEPPQVLPDIRPEDVIEQEPTASIRLQRTRESAVRVEDRIAELTQRVDERCSAFFADTGEEVGSPLYQAMVRVFGERTTTISYEHYRRAIEHRGELALEDEERLREE